MSRTIQLAKTSLEGLIHELTTTLESGALSTQQKIAVARKLLLHSAESKSQHKNTDSIWYKKYCQEYQRYKELEQRFENVSTKCSFYETQLKRHPERANGKVKSPAASGFDPDQGSVVTPFDGKLASTVDQGPQKACPLCSKNLHSVYDQLAIKAREIKELKDTLNNFESKGLQLIKKHAEMKSENDELKKKVKELNFTLDKMTISFKLLVDQNDKLRRKYKKKVKKHKDLVKRLEQEQRIERVVTMELTRKNNNSRNSIISSDIRKSHLSHSTFSLANKTRASRRFGRSTVWKNPRNGQVRDITKKNKRSTIISVGQMIDSHEPSRERSSSIGSSEEDGPIDFSDLYDNDNRPYCALI